MKKILLSIGSLLILCLVVVLFVNANPTSDPVKAEKEAPAMSCGSGCMMHTGDQPAKCNAAKCSKECAGKCDPAKCTGKDCDPATCPMHEEAKKEASACKAAAPCSATCGTAK